MPRLKQLISEQGVGDRVELRGMLTPEALGIWRRDTGLVWGSGEYRDQPIPGTAQ